MTDMTVANTILAQLGGNKFRAMTGAKSFAGDKDSLTFKLPARFAKDGITAVKIKLEPTDTYTVTFYKQRPWTKSNIAKGIAAAVVVVKEFDNVYCDTLCTVFESATGLATSL